MEFKEIIEVIKEGSTITVFVLLLMLLIEYFTVKTHGKLNLKIQNSVWKQIIFGAFLGLIPGCAGGFLAVSLFTHKIINFAALVTVMIAATGDEAFVMFAMMKTSDVLLLNVIIFIISILVGFIVNFFFKNKPIFKLNENHLKLHEHADEHIEIHKHNFFSELKNISFHRALLIAGGFFFLIFLINEQIADAKIEVDRIFYFLGVFFGLFVIIIVPEHFLKEHLWEHVIKKHAIKIFLWTTGAFLLIQAFTGFLNVEAWIKTNQFYVMLIAVLIGIIPESGPHIVFTTLFVAGTIPFSVLIANSIVQDGHSALPLLAESKKSFLYLKLINMIISLLVGLIGLYFGF